MRLLTIVLVRFTRAETYSYRPVFAYLCRRQIRPVIPPRKDGNMGKAAAPSPPDTRR